LCLSVAPECSACWWPTSQTRLFTIVGGVGLFLTPANMFWLVLLTLAIKGVGASLINTVMFGLEADTVEYGEWKPACGAKARLMRCSRSHGR
jgi:Na+/melibiose symporter-like transporter